MKKIDMENVLFHGIEVKSPYCNQFNESLVLLKSILQSGYIMNRSTLLEYISKDRNEDLYNIALNGKCNNHYGGNEVVSLGCLEISSFEEYIIEKNGNNISTKFSSGIQLLIDPLVLQKMEIIRPENRTGIIPGEIQIIGNIPIEYIMAISVNSEINMILKNINDYLFNDEDIDSRALELIKNLVNAYNNSERECLQLLKEKCFESNNRANEIKKLLKEINYDISIVDSGGEKILIENQINKGYSLTKSYKENWDKRNNKAREL